MKQIFTRLSLLLLVGITSKPFAQTPLHEFTFDNTLSNTANTVTLTSSLPLNGSTFGYTSNRFGEANKAFLNNGTGQYLSATINNLPIGNAARTIELWVKFLPGYGGDHFLAAYGTAVTNQAYGLTQTSTSVINYGWANDITAALTYTTNIWYHYAITYDGTTASVYRNGTLISSMAKTWNTVGQLLQIGRTAGNNAGIAAAIDELKIYSSVLTAAQIQNIYTLGTTSTGAPANGLLGYYSFETNYNANNGIHNFAVDPASGLNSVSAGISLGKYGKCLDVGFGTGAITNTSLSTALAGKQFSVACWVNKTNGTNNYSSAFELFSSAFYRYNFASTLQEFALAISSSNFQAATSALLPANQWVHIAVVFEKDNVNYCRLRLYQNGINIATKDIGTGAAFYQFNNKAMIGGGTNADGSIHTAKYFKGLIDEVYIYDRAITETEVAGIMYNSNSLLLPSSLSTFTAKLQAQTAQLNWATSTEINTSHFEVEYCNNAKDFVRVATINANGNSSTNKNYSASHTINNENTHYYRLKMVDKDGKFAYSSIVKLKNAGKDFTAEVYPSIVSSTATVSITAVEKAIGTICISNMHGQLVNQNNITINAGSQTEKLDVSNLQNGTYIVTIKTANQQQVLKIVKQ